jgi:ribosomal-protein-alanine N-acetyltransferase
MTTGTTQTKTRNRQSEQGMSLLAVMAIMSLLAIALLAVAPTVQKRGIGRKLLAHFIEDAKKNGAAKIHLEVRDGNAAIQLYEAAGFIQSNRRRNYYHGRDGGQFDALTFHLVLKD